MKERGRIRGSLGGMVLLALVAGGGLSSAGADDSGPMGFPTGTDLGAAEQGTGTGAGESPRRPPGKPMIPDWGPGFWVEEGGGPERNPFYSWPPQRRSPEKTSKEAPGGAPVSLPPKKEGTKAFPFTDRMHPPHVAWIRDFGQSPLNRPEFRFAHQPIVVNGRLVLTSTRGEVLCLDAVTGVTLWRKSLPDAVRAAPVSDGETLYIATGSPYITAPHMMGYAQTRTILRGTGTEHLYALSLATGKLVWQAPLPGPALGSPVLAGKTLWVATGQGWLAGYSTEKEGPVGKVRLLASPGWSAPLALHHWLWISLEGPQKLAALWPDKGRTVWSLSSPKAERLVLFSPTPSFGAMRLLTRRVSVHEGQVAEKLTILSAVSGHIFSEVPFTPFASSSTIKMAGEAYPPGARVFEGLATVTVAGQTAVVASALSRELLAADIPSGHLFWKLPLGGEPSGAVTVAGFLCVLPETGHVVLVDLATGKLLGQVDVKEVPAPGPAPIVGTTLYLAGKDGTVRAVSLDAYRATIYPSVSPPSPLASPRPRSSRAGLPQENL
ncbi:MAG: PQQ-binding-like beta-propeller repeat protein [Leptospirillia bacterium]